MASKITGLAEVINPSSGDDVVEIVIDTATTPANRRIKVLNLLKRLFLGDGTQLTITTIADGEFLKRSGTTITGGTVGSGGLADDSVTNAKLANMAQATIKGRAAGAGTGDPTDLTATQVRTILLEMQRWTLNFTANGDAYIPADIAMTIDVGVAAIGTGTLAYEKSTAAAPSTFSSTSLPATLEAGAWLKITVSALTGFKVVELKRTA